MNPVPTRSIVHCIVLMPYEPSSVDPFLESAKRRLPGLVAPANWTAVGGERTWMYGDLETDQWKWRIILETQGMPEPVAEALDSCFISEETAAAIAAHKTSVMVFLTDSPQDSGALLPMQRQYCMVSALIEAGAHIAAWPEGRCVWRAEEIAGLEPGALSAHDAGWFVSTSIDYPKHADFDWFRTHGMGQFAMPTVLTPITRDSEHRRDELKCADRTFRAVMSYLVERGSPLPIGNTLDAGGGSWIVADPQDHPSIPSSTNEFGFQLLLRTDLAQPVEAQALTKTKSWWRWR